MNIDNPAGIQRGEVLRQDAQESGQYNQVNPVGCQGRDQLLLKGHLPAAGLLVDFHGGDTGFLCALQGIGSGTVADHQNHFPVRDFSSG